MQGGFTFNGTHSSVHGVYETPSSRVLMPLKRRTLIPIPGRSTAVIQEDGGYEPRVESISCSYIAADEKLLQRKVREIAGWLSGVGELTFDYEPEMHYNAFLSSAPPTVKMLEYATFELEFTYNHPFAYETAQQISQTITNGVDIVVPTNGTEKTPVRFVIKNLGTEPIHNLIVVSKNIV